jgi:hypothetical protein
VPVRLEEERPGLAGLALRPGDAPAGYDARELSDVGLGVAGADAERMKLQNLAREILVQAPAGEFSRPGVGADGALVVEEEDHRRMGLGRPQERREVSERVRTDRFALEWPGRDAQLGALGHRDREMVRPESDEPLDETGARLQLLLQPRQRLGAELGLRDRRLWLGRRLVFMGRRHRWALRRRSAGRRLALRRRGLKRRHGQDGRHRRS